MNHRIYTEVKTNLKLATKLHRTIGDECNYLKDQINELKSRLAEKQGEQSDALYQVKCALKLMKQFETKEN